MSEFGHIAANGPGFHLDAWGAGPFVIVDEAGKPYRFEDSDRFGPYLVAKRDDRILDNQPGSRSPFWRVHRVWRRQGRRVAEDGVTCVWDEPKPTTFYRLGKRSGVVVEGGEEDGEYIEVPRPASPEGRGDA